MTVPLSVLIPTKNEEKNIRKCLESVAWADEIYVVDSCSTDRTAEIARSMGATVVPFAWNGKGPRKKTTAVKLTREAPKAVPMQQDTPLNHDERASTCSV